MLQWWLVWVIVRRFLCRRLWRLLQIRKNLDENGSYAEFFSVKPTFKWRSFFSVFIIFFLVSVVNIVMAVDSRIINVAINAIIIYLVFRNFSKGVSNVWIDVYLQSRPSNDWVQKHVFSAHMNTVSAMQWVPWVSRLWPESITTGLLNWLLLLVVCFMYFSWCVVWFSLALILCHKCRLYSGSKFHLCFFFLVHNWR